MQPWFTITQVSEDTHIISEYRHPEETQSYLLIGSERALLIDTGLGISNISQEVRKLTPKPVTAVATHIHWDHIGGHKYFSDFYVHEDEQSWLNGKYPLPQERIKYFLVQDCDVPEDFDVDEYELFQGTPTRVLKDNDLIDLGGRVLQVLHTPGHSPGHMCFYEESRGWLFTGDLIYKDVLYANFPSTDPERYYQSIERVAKMPVTHVFPGHHSLDIEPEIISRIRDAFQEINANGQLHHGSGAFEYNDFSILL